MGRKVGDGVADIVEVNRITEVAHYMVALAAVGTHSDLVTAASGEAVDGGGIGGDVIVVVFHVVPKVDFPAGTSVQVTVAVLAPVTVREMFSGMEHMVSVRTSNSTQSEKPMASIVQSRRRRML